jgi:HlyD family secretion protein
VSDKSQLSLDNAVLNSELAREKYEGKANLLASISDELSASKKQYQLDSLNFTRQKSLWMQKVGAQIDFDQAKLKYELSKSNLDRLKLRYKSSKIELGNSYKQSQLNVKKTASDVKDYFVRAKMSGKVYSLNKNEGELITLQEPLAQIGKSKTFILELLVDEVDVAKVKVGQKTIIGLDAYAGKSYEALISKIYPAKDKKTQTFLVEAKFIYAPKTLFPGLSGEANIVISQKKKVLTIPLDYLLEGNKVLTENGEIEVKTGLSNLNEVEILSGLEENTIIKKAVK